MASPLYGYIAEMLEIESQISETLDQALDLVGNRAEVSAAIGKLSELVKGQRDQLEARLKSLTDSDRQAGETTSSAPTAVSGSGGAGLSASTALQELHAAFSRAAFAYGLLHTRAHRFFDGTPEDSTGDIAQRHSQAYKEAAQQIFEMASDIAIWELDQEGQPCKCICPSCSLGICLCWHTHTAADSGSPDDRGIRIRTPKPKSEAERVGLREGDAVLTVGGQAIDSYQVVNATLNKHESGDEVTLQIQRDGGDIFEVAVTRP